MTRHLPALSLILATALALPAPGQQPGTESIRRILDKVAEELEEIDRMLLESANAPSGAGGAPEKMAEARQRMEELLEQSRSASERVGKDLDDLIRELQKMGGGGGGGGSPQQQPQSGEGQRQPEPGTRRETRTPDMVDQGQQQPRNRPSQGRPEGEPREGQERPTEGRNTTGAQEPDDATGPGSERARGDEWGQLQKYHHFLQKRGGAPKVPEKYRSLWEAYLKRQSKKGGGG